MSLTKKVLPAFFRSVSRGRVIVDAIGPTDDVVGRRIGGQRLPTDERGGLVAQIRHTHTQGDAVAQGIVDVKVDVAVGRNPRRRRRG